MATPQRLSAKLRGAWALRATQMVISAVLMDMANLMLPVSVNFFKKSAVLPRWPNGFLQILYSLERTQSSLVPTWPRITSLSSRSWSPWETNWCLRYLLISSSLPRALRTTLLHRVTLTLVPPRARLRPRVTLPLQIIQIMSTSPRIRRALHRIRKILNITTLAPKDGVPVFSKVFHFTVTVFFAHSGIWRSGAIASDLHRPRRGARRA